jgi:histone H3/H4
MSDSAKLTEIQTAVDEAIVDIASGAQSFASSGTSVSAQKADIDKLYNIARDIEARQARTSGRCRAAVRFRGPTY